MTVVAIDVGSSFLKASVLDMERQKIIKKVKMPAPERHGTDRRFEVRADAYVQFVRSIVSDCIQACGEISGLLLATQMHGYVYSTSQDPAADVYVSWQDMRCLDTMPGGQTYMAHLQRRIPPGAMEDCGVYLKPSLACCNLFTTFLQQPDLPRNGRLYTIGSYIIEKLTGRNVCHPSNAAPLGLLNAREMRWDDRMIAALDFQEIQLPEIARAHYAPCGIYEARGQKIPVFPDYGDQQVSILGCMPQAGDGIVNIATGCQVITITDHFVPGAYELRPYFEGAYLCTISNMPAGRGLDVLISFFRETAYRLTGQEVSVAEAWQRINEQFSLDAGGLAVDMSFYATPDRLHGGAVTGITHSNLHVDSLLSAAFADMAQTYRDNFAVLAGQTPIRSLICAGGVSWKIPVLVQAIKEAMGLPCRLSPIEDEALAGLYRAALCCMGINRSMYDNPHLVLHGE